MGKRLYWGSADGRSGWMIDREGRNLHVMGPSICTCSGGGPARAIEEVQDWDPLNDTVEIPPHEPLPGTRCECHSVVKNGNFKMASKQFHTLVVASAITDIGLGPEGLKFSDILELYDHVMGYPIFTHEMVDLELVATIHTDLKAAFPEMPTQEEAAEDFQKAARKAVDKYGEHVMVEAGTRVRTENPIDSHKRITGDAVHVIVSAGGDDNG